MSDRGASAFAPIPLLDPDYGIVLHAYLQLPLFLRQENGSWVAPLKRFAACELRLAEAVPPAWREPVLRVELFDLRTQTIVDSRPCEELEDAVAVYKEMIPLAEGYLNQGTGARSCEVRPT